MTIPIIINGEGFEAGKILRNANIKDIAPTIAVMLAISFPSGATGEPLYWMLDK